MTAACFVLWLAAAPVQVNAGPLTLRLHRSEAAQLFHVVDQLSSWSAFSHQQYRAHLFKADAGQGLTEKEEALLARHAALRKRVGYGALEKAFYGDGTVDEALAAAAKDKALSPDDVALLKEELATFRPRLLPFLNARKKSLDAFVAGIKKGTPQLTAFAERAAAFFRVKGASVDAWAIPSPGEGNGGGGFNGGVLTVEVTETEPPLDVLVHESWHALAEGRHADLLAAARASGFDWETVSEALAYAVSPGLYRFDGRKEDALARKVRADWSRPFFDEPLVRFARCGLALRPSLQRALADPAATLDQYLPTALAVLQGVSALYEVNARTPRGVFLFPREAKPLAQRYSDQGLDVWARNLTPDEVSSVQRKMRKQDTVVLLLTPETLDALPPPLVELLGSKWPAAAAKLKKDQRGELFLAEAGADAFVFFGPTVEDALARAQKSKLLGP